MQRRELATYLLLSVSAERALCACARARRHGRRRHDIFMNELLQLESEHACESACRKLTPEKPHSSAAQCPLALEARRASSSCESCRRVRRVAVTYASGGEGSLAGTGADLVQDAGTQPVSTGLMELQCCARSEAVRLQAGEHPNGCCVRA
jgi:hypothetical protein